MDLLNTIFPPVLRKVIVAYATDVFDKNFLALDIGEIVQYTLYTDKIDFDNLIYVHRRKALPAVLTCAPKKILNEYGIMPGSFTPNKYLDITACQDTERTAIARDILKFLILRKKGKRAILKWVYAYVFSTSVCRDITCTLIICVLSNKELSGDRMIRYIKLLRQCGFIVDTRDLGMALASSSSKSVWEVARWLFRNDIVACPSRYFICSILCQGIEGLNRAREIKKKYPYIKLDHSLDSYLGTHAPTWPVVEDDATLDKSRFLLECGMLTPMWLKKYCLKNKLLSIPEVEFFMEQKLWSITKAQLLSLPCSTETIRYICEHSEFEGKAAADIKHVLTSGITGDPYLLEWSMETKVRIVDTKLDAHNNYLELYRVLEKRCSNVYALWGRFVYSLFSQSNWKEILTVMADKFPSHLDILVYTHVRGNDIEEKIEFIHGRISSDCEPEDIRDTIEYAILDGEVKLVEFLIRQYKEYIINDSIIASCIQVRTPFLGHDKLEMLKVVSGLIEYDWKTAHLSGRDLGDASVPLIQWALSQGYSPFALELSHMVSVLPTLAHIVGE